MNLELFKRSPKEAITVMYDIAGQVCGSLTKGGKVKLHNGMIFSVADTSNA